MRRFCYSIICTTPIIFLGALLFPIYTGAQAYDIAMCQKYNGRGINFSFDPQTDKDTQCKSACAPEGLHWSSYAYDVCCCMKSCPDGKICAPNPLGIFDSSRNIPALMGNVSRGLFGIIGTIALLIFLYGGFLWMTAFGEEEKVKKGWDTLVWGGFGLGAVFGSYVFVSFILGAILSPDSTSPSSVPRDFDYAKSIRDSIGIIKPTCDDKGGSCIHKSGLVVIFSGESGVCKQTYEASCPEDKICCGEVDWEDGAVPTPPPPATGTPPPATGTPPAPGATTPPASSSSEPQVSLFSPSIKDIKEFPNIRLILVKKNDKTLSKEDIAKGPIFRDIHSHTPIDLPIGIAEIKIHEETHGINVSMTGGSVELKSYDPVAGTAEVLLHVLDLTKLGLYLGEDENGKGQGVILEAPKHMSLNDVSVYISPEMQEVNDKYFKYVGAHKDNPIDEINLHPIGLLDEFSAYLNDAKFIVDEHRRGMSDKDGSGEQGGTKFLIPVNFIPLTLAFGAAIEDNKYNGASYFKSEPQFIDILKYYMQAVVSG